MNLKVVATVSVALISGAGCLSVKTENEVKPIHITLDINLKVDKELDKAFGTENMSRPPKGFEETKRLLDRKVAGIGNKALLEVRPEATDEEKIAIAEINLRRSKRFEEIAKNSGVSLEAVQKRSLRRFEENVPAGSGVWIQRADGTWYQK